MKRPYPRTKPKPYTAKTLELLKALYSPENTGDKPPKNPKAKPDKPD